MRKLLLVVFLCCIPAWATPALVQVRQGATCRSSSAVATQTCVFSTANNTTNNQVFVVNFFDKGTANTSVITDSGLNTYLTPPGGKTCNGSDCIQLFYANITGGGGTKMTVTATYGGANPGRNELFISEWSGVATSTPLDVGNTAAPASQASPWATSAITTTNANDLVIGVFGTTSQSPTAAVSPFTLAGTIQTAIYNYIVESNTYTSTQTGLTATCTAGGTDSPLQYIVSLKASGGGGGVVRRRAMVIQR